MPAIPEASKRSAGWVASSIYAVCITEPSQWRASQPRLGGAGPDRKEGGRRERLRAGGKPGPEAATAQEETAQQDHLAHRPSYFITRLALEPLYALIAVQEPATQKTL